MEKKYALSAVSYGEVLFDLFPTHKKIGGAPLNVAIRMKSLGVQSKIISKKRSTYFRDWQILIGMMLSLK